LQKETEESVEQKLYFWEKLIGNEKKNERMKKIKSRKGECSFLGALLWVVVGSRLKLMRT
jgi:predicted metal-dependent hydrolase